MAYLSKQQENKLINSIDKIPALRFCGIAYVGQGNSYVIRPSQMPDGLGTWIVISEVKEQYARKPEKEIVRESNFSWGWELFGLGTSCGAAILTGVAAAGGVAATPLTGGTSLALTTLAWAGATATAAQCGISIGRFVNEWDDPRNNQILDENAYYQYGSTALDTVSIVGGASSVKGAVKFGHNLSKATGKPIVETLRGSDKIARGARKRLPRIMAESKNPGLSSKQFKRMVRDGKAPKVFRTHEITREVNTRLLESVSAVLSGMGSSASDTGIINKVAVFIVNEDKNNLSD